MTRQKGELLPFWFPKSKRDQIWAIVFISLTILSIWWNWDSDQRFGEWIPTWIVYLIIIQFALAYSVWKFSQIFNPAITSKKIIQRKVKIDEKVKPYEPKSEPEQNKDDEPEDNGDSNTKNVTNIYISDSVISRSIVGGKDEKDE